MEIDTDAQLHKERVISVRKEAEFLSRVLQERCPRWNADTLETSCQCDVEEFQELIKVAQKTVVTPQVPRQVQMIQTMTRSKVQNMPTPDLEQRAEKEEESVKSSTQHSADGAPHEPQGKVKALGEGLIQQTIRIANAKFKAWRRPRA